MTRVDDVLDRVLARLTDQRTARQAFWVAVGVTLVIWYVVGRHQWFIRDDWAFLITRDLIRQRDGVADWLNVAQDGHWMAVPILAWRGLQNLFGIDSYWTYLAPMLAVNLGIVLLVRLLCRRVGVHEWTATLVCSTLLVFGSGWENIVFAIQLTYNLSLLCFLAHLLLADHDGPPDRRDAIGVAIGLVGVMSSGFGPFFIAGIAVFLAVRQRWLAMLIAASPLALAWGAWFLVWGADPAADSLPSGRTQVPAFARRGIFASFDGLTAMPTLAGVVVLAALGVLVWRGVRSRDGAILVTLAATTVLMFLGVGWQRAGLGAEAAAASRYVFMGAVLLAPLFALTVDQVGKLAEPGVWAARLLLAVAVVLNAGWLVSNGNAWAALSSNERHAFELLAGSPLSAQADPLIRPAPFSPDVSMGDIPWLVEEGAITPRPVVTPADQALLDQALAGQVGRVP
jgi:hypothetical protein